MIKLVQLLLLLIVLFVTDAKCALNKTTCASLITAKIKIQNPDTNEAQIKPFWEAICEGLIEHIQTDAVVNSTGTGTATITGGSSSGVWPTTDSNVGTIQ